MSRCILAPSARLDLKEISSYIAGITDLLDGMF